jgi:hypothetical protein
MAGITLTSPDGSKISFYLDNNLKEKLDKKIKNIIIKKDKDWIGIIDGDEGSGKSNFAQQIGKYLDPELDLSRICMNPQEFIHAISTAPKGSVIVYDEAYTGLSSRGTLSEINNLLVSMMMEMRQKNLIVFIVLPTFFLLDKYVALWRAKGLFHIYERRGERGYWIFFNKRKKKILYLKGKKEYSYKGIKSNFKGRFYNTKVLDWDLYLKKKDLALKSRDRRTKSEKYINQRNNLLYLLYDNFNVSIQEIGNLCKKYNIDLKKSVIAEIIKNIRDKGFNNPEE